MGKGCKIALIIFAILAVMAIAAIIVGYLYCERIGVALIGQMVDGVEVSLLKDLPDGFEESEVKAVFREFREAVDAGVLKDSVNAHKLERLGQAVKEALDDDRVDGPELKYILELMREISSSVRE